MRWRSGALTTLGAFAFRALARALAWLALFGRAGTSLGRATGVVRGADVMLRQNVTIGNIRRGPGDTTACPVIEDGVEFGAGAVVVQ